ncbi:SDR family oxidoreductase [Streptomyces sp. NA04227]|uniref:SDR family NAD(P)-dependent oxidoreductase n=1 Tax=Streptomyces sp. NA04227 TaxID=2742136 RepID=UPI001591E823|nr:SDR family oxidoreductase [Streptomyces sp. NA04227]QKW10370.1 SDR family oxidoreductase [Streptomyces sp. NA04227]
MTRPVERPSGSAVVTGGGGSLGRATALRLGADGYDVAVLDLPGEGLDTTSASLDAAGVKHLALGVDLREATAIPEAVDTVEHTLGPVHALVNNAAVYPNTPFLEVTFAEYDEVVAVNQRAYFLAAQAAARLMVPRGRGAIVNLASITWHGGWANLSGYVSTKGAAVSLTRALARELGPSGIRVNAVSPGAFPTKAETIHDNPEEYARFVVEHQSLKRRGTGEELAAVVSFLLGPDSSFVTGQTVNVDGGWVMG